MLDIGRIIYIYHMFLINYSANCTCLTQHSKHSNFVFINQTQLKLCSFHHVTFILLLILPYCFSILHGNFTKFKLQEGCNIRVFYTSTCTRMPIAYKLLINQHKTQ